MTKVHAKTRQRKPKKHPPGGSTNLDTLVHLRKPLEDADSKGINLYKRARSTYIKNVLAYRLIDLHSDNERAYWRMQRCSQVIYQDNGTMTTRFCNNRFCIVCGRIRTAKAMTAYLGQLRAMDELRFVTLTVPAVDADDFSDTVRGMNAAFRRILDKHRKRGHSMKGIRKLEANYNAEADTYNPHFHVLMEGQAEAEALLSDWLDIHSEAREVAQDIEPADDATVKELFKYFTKIFREEDGRYKVHPKAMDRLYTELKGRRTFQPFGGVKAEAEPDDMQTVIEEYREELKESIVWMWSDAGADWVDYETGRVLTGHVPDKRTRKMTDDLRKK